MITITKRLTKEELNNVYLRISRELNFIKKLENGERKEIYLNKIIESDEDKLIIIKQIEKEFEINSKFSKYKSEYENNFINNYNEYTIYIDEDKLIIQDNIIPSVDIATKIFTKINLFSKNKYK